MKITVGNTLWAQLVICGCISGVLGRALGSEPPHPRIAVRHGASFSHSTDIPTDISHDPHSKRKLHVRAPGDPPKGKGVAAGAGAGGTSTTPKGPIMIDCFGKDLGTGKAAGTPKVRPAVVPAQKKVTTPKKGTTPGAKKSKVKVKRTGNTPPQTPAPKKKTGGGSGTTPPGAPLRGAGSGSGQNPLSTPSKPSAMCPAREADCGLHYDPSVYFGLTDVLNKAEITDQRALMELAMEYLGDYDGDDTDGDNNDPEAGDFDLSKIAISLRIDEKSADEFDEANAQISKNAKLAALRKANSKKRYSSRKGAWKCEDDGVPFKTLFNVALREHPKIDEILANKLDAEMLGYYGDHGHGAHNGCLMGHPDILSAATGAGKLFSTANKWGLAVISKGVLAGDELNVIKPNRYLYHTEHIYEANWIRAFWRWVVEDQKLLKCQDMNDHVFGTAARADRDPQSTSQREKRVIDQMADELGNYWHTDRLAILDGPTNMLKYRVFSIMWRKQKNLLIPQKAEAGDKPSQTSQLMWDKANPIIFAVTRLRKMMMVIEYMREPKVEKGFFDTVTAMDKILVQAEPRFQGRITNLAAKHHEFLEIMIEEANCAVIITAVSTAQAIVKDQRWAMMKKQMANIESRIPTKYAAIKKDVLEVEGLAKVSVPELKGPTNCSWPRNNHKARKGFRSLKAGGKAKVAKWFTPWEPKLPAIPAGGPAPAAAGSAGKAGKAGKT